ncbi:MAG: hypothetical protein IMZ73_12740 [Chloroflexi bacterium]|nr:hypothetical protein [Chloroflexota bacterium]
MRPVLRHILKPFLCLSILLFYLAGCGSTPTPVPDSGVEGHVFIGPVCPVVQVNNPCPDKPYQTTLSILDQNGKKILTFQTDADGFFRVPLPSGDYILSSDMSTVLPRAMAQPFSVRDGEFTELSITFDSGLR